jgi:entericidin A
MKKLSLLVLVAYATLLTACNTMEGLGKDVQKLGDKIERKAEEKRN